MLDNVPSFALASDVPVTTSRGPVTLDIGFGGAFYGILDVRALGLTVAPVALPELIALLAENDMVVGARTGGKVEIPWARRPAKWFLNQLANYLSEARIPDLNSGLRAFRRDEVQRFFGILPSGFSFTTTITLAMHVNDRSVAYVPVDYHRRQGRSKIRPVQDTLGFLALIVRTVLYFRPLKIFLPISGFLFLLSIAILVYSALFTEKIMDASVTITLMTSFQMAAIGLLADLIDKRSQR